MAIQKPFNISIKSKTIDANEANVISWQISGDISYAYQVLIYSNDDNSLVFDSTRISTFALTYTLQSYTLTNGKTYKIQVVSYGQNGDSAASYYEVFQTSSRPIVTLPPIGLVANSSYSFSATYSQAENVGMQSYITYLYDASKIAIAQSNVLTDNSTSYMFSNLQDGESYYIEFQITSTKGLTGTSGLVLFNVSYSQPKVDLHLTANNVDHAGIEIAWSVVQILGQSTNASFVNGEKLDVTNGTVYFHDGFNVDSDFTLKLWLDSPIHNASLVSLSGDNGEIVLLFEDYDNRFHLKKTVNGVLYEVVSDVIASGRTFFIALQQIGDYMNIKCEVLA